MHARFLLGLAVLVVDVMPCSHPHPPPDVAAAKRTEVAAATPAAAAAPAKVTYDRLERLDFNRRAAEHFLPLFWRADTNHNKALDPDELAFLMGYGAAKRTAWVGKDGFTDAFAKIYASLSEPAAKGATPDEQKRRDAIILELSQGRTTLVETDFTAASAEDKAIVEHVMKAALIAEQLYARQLGSFGLDQKIPSDDPASRMVFYRNQKPQCVAPKTENDPDCSALPEKPKRIVGLYPADIQSDPKFCDMLAKQPNAKELMDHFSIVVAGDKPGTFKAVPYAEAWKTEMQSVAAELDLAAAAITSPDEGALKTYLTAQAQAFRTNDWESANGPWAAMGATNSKWYLRLAPDETYYEPCAWKAGFATSFARINPDSLAWQKKLDPVKNEMEKALATMAGAPYKARDVKFKLPDFIDIVLNGGNDRDPHGATAGQSLPNWGKVADAGGRTVTMTNLYTDEDSRAALAAGMASLLCPATNAQATTDGKNLLPTVVLHEAAHNLGPAHEYKVKGKVDDVVFGGTLASMLEELKAENSALFFVDWLVDKKLMTADDAQKAHVRDVAWAFGHISRGMYDGSGSPKAYSQLASIMMGSLSKGGALKWNPEVKAANGTDVGCFELEFAKVPVEVKKLEAQILKIKASGDKKGAEAMKAQWVDAKDDWAKLRDLITERWLRAPKASFVYAVKL